MRVLILCEKYHLAGYQGYLDQPTWFLDAAWQKYLIDRERSAKENGNMR